MPIHTDIVCFSCGCLCDDLVVETADDQILQVTGACSLGAGLFQQFPVPEHGSFCDGNPVEHAAAISTAVQILQNSRAPLIFGMQSTATDGQRQAIELAETIGAVIDTAGSPLTRATMTAMQQVGMSTCTLGEVRQRADLVIFWGADPQRTHPRLIDRLCGEGPTEFLPNGRNDRTLVGVTAHQTATDVAADITISLPAAQNAAAIAALRQWLRNPDWQPEGTMAFPVKALHQLAMRMTSARYGVLFFGTDFVQGNDAVRNVTTLLQLVTELNAFTRFSARPLTNPGAEQVLTWQTGFPFAVNFQHGYPLYQPGEFSAEELLVRREVDGCILIGSNCLANFSPAALNTLQTIPTIVIDPPRITCPFTSQVRFVCAHPGVHSSGTAYRLDGVALPLRQLVNSCLPPAESILRELRECFLTTAALVE